MSEILVVGSLGYDTISTPVGRREQILGGSANYFSLAASVMAPVNVVGVVGDDYQPEHIDVLVQRGVNTTGLQRVPGKTFFWEGKYEADMNEAVTLVTQLNVFENFRPQVPENFHSSKYLFLANIDPVLQMQVLEQVSRPAVVGADTMNFWITSKRKELDQLLKKIDVLLINEGEIRQLTGRWNVIAAAKEILQSGPKAVVVKRGEYGFMLMGEGAPFMLPAFPVDEVVDPTGAGDTFAGGFFGYLSSCGGSMEWECLKRACVNGCLLASFTVQDFGVEAIQRVTPQALADRLVQYRQIIAYPEN